MVLTDQSAHPRVVPLHGEHDSSTAGDLAALLAGEIALDGADLVVDLREVTFLGASTLGTLVGARRELGAQGRNLAVRSPSCLARRTLAVCGLGDLVARSPGEQASRASKAS